MRTIHVKGRVFSGIGEGTKFIELPWAKKQIAEKLKFTPYPGTLNIKLPQPHTRLTKLLRNAKGTEICPAKGFCRGKYFEAYLMKDVKCAIVIPEIASYPEDVIEIIAPINLRERLQLKDGDIVEVKIILS